MPSFIRMALLAAIFLAFSPIALATPLSSPLPLSMPRFTPSYYYIPRHANESDITLAPLISRSFPIVFPVSPEIFGRDDYNRDDKMLSLVQEFKTLAAESGSPADKTSYTEKCLVALRSLLEILLQLKDDCKGGRFRNNQDELQIYIKYIINVVKECLSLLVQIVKSTGLGRELGPIVFDVKCLLDDFLNVLEEVLDLSLDLVELPDDWRLITDAVNEACSLCGHYCA